MFAHCVPKDSTLLHSEKSWGVQAMCLLFNKTLQLKTLEGGTLRLSALEEALYDLTGIVKGTILYKTVRTTTVLFKYMYAFSVQCTDENTGQINPTKINTIDFRDKNISMMFPLFVHLCQTYRIIWSHVNHNKKL
jgi:hypothetical protein